MINFSVWLAVFFVHICAAGIFPAAAQERSPQEPLMPIFRVLEPEMPEAEALRIITNAVIRASGHSVHTVRGAGLILLTWEGQDLLYAERKPISNLQVMFLRGRLWCATYIFFYAGQERPVMEPRHKGAIECRMMP